MSNEWRALQSRSGACLFTCYDWFCGWWQTMGRHKNRTLHITAAMRNGRLVGILPLMVRKKFGLRILEWAGNEIFDYCSTLAEEDAIAYELWESVRKSPHYDFAVIKDVHPSTPESLFLSTFAKKFGHIKALYTKLEWPTSKAWRESRGKKQRKDFKHKSTRLEQIGPVKFEVSRDGAVPDDIINEMISQKLLWCSHKRKNGIFSHSLIAQAFCRMGEVASKQEKLFLATLKCGEAPVSRIFGFIDREVLHCYFTCYDPAWAQYSPGALIFTHAIGWAIDNGLKEYDFMRGDEGFKLRYATGARELPTYGFARTPLGFCGCLACRLLYCGNRRAKMFAKSLPLWAQKHLLLLRKSHSPADATV